MSEMYTEHLLEHYRHPRNEGHLDQPDVSAEEYNPLCGDRVRVDARVVAGRIVEARFTGRGCALCLASASILTGFLEGRHLDDLQSTGARAFLAELHSPIRPARLRCALLPWKAFRRAAFGEEEWPEAGESPLLS
jgi:nitrogen fixation NifU-like protein